MQRKGIEQGPRKHHARRSADQRPSGLPRRPQCLRCTKIYGTRYRSDHGPSGPDKPRGECAASQRHLRHRHCQTEDDDPKRAQQKSRRGSLRGSRARRCHERIERTRLGTCTASALRQLYQAVHLPLLADKRPWLCPEPAIRQVKTSRDCILPPIAGNSVTGGPSFLPRQHPNRRRQILPRPFLIPLHKCIEVKNLRSSKKPPQHFYPACHAPPSPHCVAHCPLARSDRSRRDTTMPSPPRQLPIRRSAQYDRRESRPGSCR